MSQTIEIIMYHYVRELPNTRYPDIKGLLLSHFREQLRFLLEHGRTFVSGDQILESAHGGKPLPEGSVLLTFDDGYLDHYTNVFPFLDSMGIPAFFSMPGKIVREKSLLDVNRIHFILASQPVEKLLPMTYELLDYYRGKEFEIPSNKDLYNKLAVANRFDPEEIIFLKRLLQVELPEKLRNLMAGKLFAQCVGIPEPQFVDELYMSLEQVKVMQRHGMTWGIHGYDHYWMNRLTQPELEKDLAMALDVFDGIVPRNGWWCCYPYGSCSRAVIQCAGRFGAAGGFTTEVRVADLEKDSIFELPRLDTVDYPPRSNNYLKYKEGERV